MKHSLRTHQKTTDQKFQKRAAELIHKLTVEIRSKCGMAAVRGRRRTDVSGAGVALLYMFNPSRGGKLGIHQRTGICNSLFLIS